MPLTQSDRTSAAKMGMSMSKKAPPQSKIAKKMAAAGGEEATEASYMGASKTPMNEKTGKKE
jgi:hypothetical protein